ncbi:MAG: Lipoprotein signal peptidase [Evtepia sp.]|jgi:signal peptidase II|nr:Lipoprotein signal peptidase [Evtepia sp.]
MCKRNAGVFYLFIAVAIVAVDQLVKNSIRQTLPLFETRPFLPGFVELTYVKNTGAAFSMLASHTWLLALISAVVAGILLVVLLRGIVPSTLGQLSLALVLGGAVGNLIDRVWLGYVVDMFSLQFMNFAIFNVADIGVTVGGVLLCISVLFFWDKKGEESNS